VINDPLTPDVGVIPIDAMTARWRVWASKARRVELVTDPAGHAERVAMEPEGHGYFTCTTAMPETGLRYAYALDGGSPVPDPCSRWQPDGVFNPSAVYFPERFEWDEGGWTGVEQRDLVFYELHVGTFTPEGTLDALIPRIDALRELGVTAIELMPMAQFSGSRGWGYDGVYPFAVQNSYGGPEALQRLVQACHRKGMVVVLDVVFNHFGPEGNVLPGFGDYLTETYKTGWGAAVNYDGRGCDPVRASVLANTRMWVRDFRVDGLRLDAADQIIDRSPRHILSEVVEVAQEEAARLGRRAHVFAETDQNDAPRYLHPRDRGGHGADGHWNDDFHHALHVVLTGETNGYYMDFADGPAALAKVLREGFVNNGNYSRFRGRRHGTPATAFTGDRLVAFTQNHDQVGNRVRSDRYAASLPPSALRLAAGVLLLAPRLPLLFMGDEYGESNPFHYFCDFRSPELVDAVRRGRKAEFAHFGWEEEHADPFDPATRDAAVLSWSWDDPVRGGLRRLYRDLLRLRRESPALRGFEHARTRLLGRPTGSELLEMVRGYDTPGALTVVFNLVGSAQSLPAPYAGRRPSFRSETAEYGAIDLRGSGPPDWLRPHEFVIFETTAGLNETPR
jgi:maltooligosyltrehalose trehalohydrolase